MSGDGAEGTPARLRWRPGWPGSLFARTTLVLLAAMVVSTLAGLALYTSERAGVLARARADQLADQVSAAAAVIETTPIAERRRVLRSLRGPGVRLMWMQRPLVIEDSDSWQIRPIREALLTRLGDETPVTLRLSDGRPGSLANWRTRGGGPPGWHDHGPMAGAGPPPPIEPGPAPGALFGALKLNDGTWLNFAAPLQAFRPFWATPFFLLQVLSTAIVTAVALWAVRRATRPVTMLVRASERLGRDMNAPPLDERGPREVRAAAAAFNRMQANLQRFVRDRTRMLAAISHDLRTPITRLRLRAEFVDDPQQQAKMLADLDAIQAMIDATLTFARDDPAREPVQTFDLAALVQSVCDDAQDAGGDVTYAGETHRVFHGRPTALRRAFVNLVENAVTYGERARVGIAGDDGMVLVTIEDDGPGIPEDARGRVFEPFFRLDPSRSRETGGVGLGLAISRDAIVAHGGSIGLDAGVNGGLKVLIRLPGSGEIKHGPQRETDGTGTVAS